MTKKKSDTVNFEKRKSLLMQAGFIFSISLAILILEYDSNTPPRENNVTYTEIEVELVEYKANEPKKKIRPPLPKQELLVNFNLVENNSKIASETNYSTNFEIHELEPINIDLNPQDETTEDISWFYYEKKPEFPGGVDALKNYIKKNLVYPQEAIDGKIQGRVYVRFVINQSGLPEQVQVIRKIAPLLDNEAERIISTMPAWEPGEINGRKISLPVVLPISFVIL